MAQASWSLVERKFGDTTRRDFWWIQPAAVFLALSAFIVYATWAAFQGEHYEFGPYLSPFYSPLLFGDGPHAWFGPKPGWWPGALPFSAALLILWAPGGFRFTCYYYRGAYYKAFWADPLNCAVGEPKFRGGKYRGEAKLPLILQNAHRYFFYVAVVFIGLLSYDAIQSYFFDDGGHTRFGIGVGSLVLTINPILLGGYTFGCHAARHLFGGRKDRISELGGARRVYDCVSCLNRRHLLWAWMSLFW